MTAGATTSSAKAEPTRGKERLRAFHEEGAIQKTYDLRLLVRLIPFVRPHARFLVVSLTTLVVLCGLRLGIPVLMGQVVERAGAGDADGIMSSGIRLAGVIVVVQLLTFAQVYSMQLVGARAMADLRLHVFRFLQRLELRYFDRTPVGRLVTRATNDVDALGELFASGVLNAMGDFLMLAGIVVMMLILDWRLSLIAFAALPVVGAIVNAVRRRSREAYREIRAKTARLNAFLNEQVNGIAVVQAFNREEAMAREFDGINLAYRDANKRAIYYEALLDAAIEMVSTVCIASVLWWAGLHRLGPLAVSFPLVVTFTQYIRQFFEPVSLISQRYTMLQSAMAGGERIFELLDEAPLEADDSPDASKTAIPPGPEGEALALDNVTFGYKPGVPVLQNVSLSARRGERIALVGATGSGKTTIASLLLRLYEVDSGAVRVLGRDVSASSRLELRSQFSVVPQDVFLFSGSVLSNVAMSDPAADRARAAAAIERIGALELFKKRGAPASGGSAEDAWLDARVDERGQNFSAGERQLIAFARAIYKDAPVLILDEATASVDSDTEARLQKAVEAVMVGRTSLIIAHRLSTIRATSRIVVLHKGRVVEIGTHDELLAQGGVYARLYRLQFARAEADEAHEPD